MRRSPLRASAGRYGWFILVLLLCTSVPSPGSGQPNPERSPPTGALGSGSRAATVAKVSWPDIIRAVDQHPRIAAQAFQIDAARGAVGAAGAVPNPSVDATVGRGDARAGDESRTEWGLELSLPLGWLAQRRPKIEAAEAEASVTVAESGVLRRDVILELRTLFWTLAYDQARVAALEDLGGQTADLVRSIKRRVETGEVRPSEATRIEIELERVTSDLEAARSSLHARQAQLKLWFAGANNQELVIEADIASVPSTLDLDTALAEARSRHPSIEAARARVRALTAAVDVEKMARLPSVAIKGFTIDELDRRAVGGGLAVDVPLWNWNAGRIAQAKAQLEAGRKRLEYEAREIESSIIEAQGACLAASHTAVRYMDRILPRSEAAASTMERTYQLGEASLLEVIDARRVLVETRRQYLAALLQSQLDCSRLNALAGQDESL